MDEMIYLAMTGAKQTEFAQAINTNNLANVSTTGFRADLHSFSSAPIEGPGVDSRINAVVDSYGTDFTEGAVATTGRNLDIAINGDGFIAVQSDDGSEAYTRAGNLTMGPGGLLTTGSGHLVLGNGGPVAIPDNQSLTIGSDGSISVVPVGQTPETIVNVDRIKLVNPDTTLVSKGADGLFRLPDGEIANADPDVTVTAETLEQSNVNIAKTLVNMIELSRQYEMQINVIKTAEEDAAAAAEMMAVG